MKLLKFLWDDTKETFSTLWAIITGKAKLKHDRKELFKIDWLDMLKTYWPFFIVVILAFCMGYYYSAKVYEDACNKIIADLQYTMPGLFPTIHNLTTNLTHLFN